MVRLVVPSGSEIPTVLSLRCGGHGSRKSKQALMLSSVYFRVALRIAESLEAHIFEKVYSILPWG